MYLLIVWVLSGDVMDTAEYIVDKCPGRKEIREAFDFFGKQDIYIATACKRVERT